MLFRSIKNALRGFFKLEVAIRALLIANVIDNVKAFALMGALITYNIWAIFRAEIFTDVKCLIVKLATIFTTIYSVKVLTRTVITYYVSVFIGLHKSVLWTSVPFCVTINKLFLGSV